ncbi:MAG TPA: alpha/beta hydrolase [Ktedonobacterales bacterium]
MGARQRQIQRNALRTALWALGISGAAMGAYLGIAAYAARKLAFSNPLAIEQTPAECGMDFREVSFVSRDEGVLLRGWLIPGIGAGGQPTLERTVIAVHGAWQNRTDPAAGLLDLCCALARAGFAVLTFDLRGHGESQRAPFTLGYSEQRDILGAVDFLCGGALPYPGLARPAWIGGYGVSMGASALLYAAAAEPAIRAVVSDSAFAEMRSIIERELPQRSRLPRYFIPGILHAARALYGVDVAAVRPVEAVAAIAPRPLLLIQGGADAMNPVSSLDRLAWAAGFAPRAHVLTWRVPNVPHAQAFHQEREAYVALLVSFLATSFHHDAYAAAADADRAG